MSAAAELRGDFVHVHLVAFRAQADAREFGFDFLEDARDDDRLDGADVVNEPLGIVALRAGAGEIGFLQPQIGDLVVGSETEFAVNMLEMAANGVNTYVQLVRDGFVGITLREQLQDLLLPHGKSRGFVPDFRFPPEGLDDPARDLTRHGGASTHHVQQGRS